MSEDQFKDWKDNSEFFFNYLQGFLDEIPERMANIGEQLGDCNPIDINQIHKLAAVTGAKADLLRQIVGIEYDDVFGGEDD